MPRLSTWLTVCPPAMLPNLVQRDSPLPHLPNEILLQIISTLQSNRDDKSHGTLYSFLRVSRTCYSMAFQALYQCPYVTATNCDRLIKSLNKFGYGSTVKRLHLRCLNRQASNEVNIIQQCQDGLEEFIAIESSLLW